MATNREEQILEWIKQNPMISQNELAQLAGITRSGVAAHISNLMKKGYLQGKGYVITPPQYLTVIGGVNIDTFGMAQQNITNRSSYPGKIYNRLGGVGRNIAVNLSQLGLTTYLMTAFGDDRNGERVKEDALQHGVDISHSQQVLHQATSNYLYVDQPNGDRVVGIDDMAINRFMTPAYLAQRKSVINHSQLVIIDSNLPKATIRWVFNNVTVPVLAKAVGLNKVMNLYDGLNQLDTLVINGIEAAILTKQPVNDETTVRACVQELLRHGVQHVFLYVDELGMAYADATHFRFIADQQRAVRNTNGAGAAATAGLAWARLKRANFDQTATAGITAAYVASEAYDSVNSQLTAHLLMQRRAALFE